METFFAGAVAKVTATPRTEFKMVGVVLMHGGRYSWILFVRPMSL